MTDPNAITRAAMGWHPWTSEAMPEVTMEVRQPSTLARQLIAQACQERANQCPGGTPIPTAPMIRDVVVDHVRRVEGLPGVKDGSGLFRLGSADDATELQAALLLEVYGYIMSMLFEGVRVAVASPNSSPADTSGSGVDGGKTTPKPMPKRPRSKRI